MSPQFFVKGSAEQDCLVPGCGSCTCA